eukprot:5740090-Pleurochrysis_carterae.AAC.1
MQRLMFDPGVYGGTPLHMVSATCAMSVPIGCTFTTVSALAPTCCFLAKWFRLAWRAQANASRRASARGCSAADDRRPYHRALARMTLLSAARSDALDRTVHHALRAQLLGACCCVALVLVYCYLIHGSTLLGINVNDVPVHSKNDDTLHVMLHECPL